MTTAQRARIERVKIIQSLLDDGYSQSEVAQKMGISRQAVNQLLKRPAHSARDALFRAVKSGYIKKPKLCSKCNEQKPLQGHHDDYNKPLEVIWVCEPCHVEVDKKGRNELNRYRINERAGFLISQARFRIEAAKKHRA